MLQTARGLKEILPEQLFDLKALGVTRQPMPPVVPPTDLLQLAALKRRPPGGTLGEKLGEFTESGAGAGARGPGPVKKSGPLGLPRRIHRPPPKKLEGKAPSSNIPQVGKRRVVDVTPRGSKLQPNRAPVKVIANPTKADVQRMLAKPTIIQGRQEPSVLRYAVNPDTNEVFVANAKEFVHQDFQEEFNTPRLGPGTGWIEIVDGKVTINDGFGRAITDPSNPVLKRLLRGTIGETFSVTSDLIKEVGTVGSIFDFPGEKPDAPGIEAFKPSAETSSISIKTDRTAFNRLVERGSVERKPFDFDFTYSQGRSHEEFGLPKPKLRFDKRGGDAITFNLLKDKSPIPPGSQKSGFFDPPFLVRKAKTGGGRIIRRFTAFDTPEDAKEMWSAGLKAGAKALEIGGTYVVKIQDSVPSTGPKLKETGKRAPLRATQFMIDEAKKYGLKLVDKVSNTVTNPRPIPRVKERTAIVNFLVFKKEAFATRRLLATPKHIIEANKKVPVRDEIFDEIFGGMRSSETGITPDADLMRLKGTVKRFWGGVFDVRDGKILEVVQHKTAEQVDFHHSHWVSNKADRLINKGDADVFFMSSKGDIEVTFKQGKVKPRIIGLIEEQIDKLKPPKKEAFGPKMTEIAHSVETLDELQGIRKKGLNPSSSVELASKKAFASGTFRLIFDEDVTTLGREVSRSFAPDMPFIETGRRVSADKIKRIEVDVDNLPEAPRDEDAAQREFYRILNKIERLTPLFDESNPQEFTLLFTEGRTVHSANEKIKPLARQLERALEKLDDAIQERGPDIHIGNYKKVLEEVFGPGIKIRDIKPKKKE